MLLKDKIIKNLEEGLSLFYLNVDDFSESHRGHAGYRDGGESHFSILVISDDFIGHSLSARHRMIYSLLHQEIKGGIHALKLKTLTVEESEKKNTPI